MWIFAVRGLKFLAVNRAAIQKYGYSEDEFLRMTITQLHLSQEAGQVADFSSRLDSRTPSFGLSRHVRKDGRTIDVELYSYEIDYGNYRARLVLANDITDRIRTERQLRTGYSVTRQLMEATSVREALPRILRAVCESAGWEYGEAWRADLRGGSLRLDASWGLTGLDTRALEDAGRALGAFRGQGLFGQVWATGRARWIADLRDEAAFRRRNMALAIGLRQVMVIPLVGRLANEGVLAFFSAGTQDPDEDLLELMADLGARIGQAIEAEEAEASRRVLEERFHKAFYDSPTPSVVSSLSSGRIVDVNDAYLELIGFTRGETLGRTAAELGVWSLQDRAGFLEALNKQGTIRAMDSEILAKDGTRRYVRIDAGVITLADDPMILSTIMDVTDRHRAAEKTAFLASIVEHSTDPIVSKTLDGTITSWNAAAERLYGWKAEEVVGRSVAVIMPPGSEEELRDIMQRLGRGETIERYETTRVRKDGTIVDVAVTISPIRSNGRITGASVMTRDITDLRAAELRLIEAQKAASVAHTATYVAHQLNTPLTNIALLSASAARKTEDPYIRERLEKIDTQRRMAGQIIRSLLSMTRAPDLHLLETDLRELVVDAASQVEAFRPEGVESRIETGEAPVRASVDPLRIREAIVNLIKNAYQATTRGSVTVRTEDLGDRAAVAVADTGVGIPADAMPALFTPFFTTHPDEGTGIGLAFAKSIVDAHGGEILVESEVGRGTTFRIVLPKEPKL